MMTSNKKIQWNFLARVVSAERVRKWNIGGRDGSSEETLKVNIQE